MTSKILWIVCGIVSIAFTAYVVNYFIVQSNISINNLAPNTNNTTDSQFPQKNTQPQPIDWEEYMPQVKEKIIQAFKTPLALTDSITLSTKSTRDITNDAIPEVFVRLGQGGAATVNSTVMRFKNNTVEVVQCKVNEDVYPCIFTSGGRITYLSNFEFSTNGVTEIETIFSEPPQDTNQYKGVVESQTIKNWVWNPSKEYLEIRL